MGGGTWDPTKYAAYSDSIKGRSVHDNFTTNYSAFKAKAGTKLGLDPKGIKVRESRDSDANPNSTPLIIALDVTGSMGRLANVLAQEGLGIVFSEILSRKPITDPHLMFMAVGDVDYDSAPLQVSQFEADDRIIPQLADIYVEGGGGGNHHESYNLPWYFAAMHTSTDAVEKRGKKGYLFTVGDEQPPTVLTRKAIEEFIGDTPERDFSNADLLQMAGRMYHIFHIMIAEGSHASAYGDRVRSEWTALLGQRAVWLKDHTKLAEVIVSILQVNEGADKNAVAASWSGDTSLVVRDAITDLTTTTDAGSGGVKRL
jgi:hypothetical protein